MKKLIILVLTASLTILTVQAVSVNTGGVNLADSYISQLIRVWAYQEIEQFDRVCANPTQACRNQLWVALNGKESLQIWHGVFARICRLAGKEKCETVTVVENLRKKVEKRWIPYEKEIIE